MALLSSLMFCTSSLSLWRFRRLWKVLFDH